MAKYKYLWITWERQRRNISLSKEISAKLVEIDLDLHSVIRYPVSIYKTVLAVFINKPDLLVVQNPSIVLAFLAMIYHKLTKLPLAIDSHNSGVYPTKNKQGILNKLAKIIIKNSSLTIVTNMALSRYVENVGGRSIIIPDPIPQFQFSKTTIYLQGVYNVLFICTWAEDEPYDEVIKAAQCLSKHNIHLYITGNSNGKEKEYFPLAENITLTGFMDENEYLSMLHSCDLVIDLTIREDCLVCGAYESISAEKPLLLSDTSALRGYFGDAAVYTINQADHIAKAVLNAKKNQQHLENRVKEAKLKLLKNWEQDLYNLNSQLENLVLRGC